MKNQTLVLVLVALVVLAGGGIAIYFLTKKPTTDITQNIAPTDKLIWENYKISANESVDPYYRSKGYVSIDDLIYYFSISKATFISGNPSLSGVTAVQYGSTIKVPRIIKA